MSNPPRATKDRKPEALEKRCMLELRFPSDSRYLHMIHELTCRLAASSGFEELEAGKIAMAVEEATTNVMQHAYHGAADREIEIHFDPDGESLNILILHDGEGLDRVPMPEFDLGKLVAERRKGGLGLYIMRQMMDDLRFGKADSGRNTCVMVRYKQRGARGEPGTK